MMFLGKYPPSRTELKSDNYQKVDIEPVVESDLSIDLFVMIQIQLSKNQ